ncbi:hybrid sensor histidine kinase/response regulator [Roseateles violae]|uniref:histidine kinase n=1 Tax=Roseateles violae TaxID=3058042 RepID=A0ABT8DPA4_9BURK|nr:ATP-binding protein [Pelomonas sp. PFR6]MDN3920186.1 ATP-binding protein [Pelomonas sp. PFR6]
MLIERAWLRWSTATLAFVAATWLNLPLQQSLEGRAPLMPYFLALVLVGLLCGLLPALALLSAACLAILYFWIEPIGQFFPINSVADVALILLFCGVGALVAAVSAWARQLMHSERRSRERLHLALGAGRMVAWDWDAQKGFAMTAGGAAELFGHAWTAVDDMVLGMAPDDAARFKAAYREASERGGRFSLVCAIRAPADGRQSWARFDGDVELDARGHALRAYGVAVDVTANEEALRASRAAEERVQLALEIGKVMAWECDAQARYTWAVNLPPGLSRERLIGAEVGSLIAHPQFTATLREAIASGRNANLAHRVSRGGREHQLMTSLRPMRSEDGRVRRVIGATVDVTELTVAQEDLRRESQRKDAFLATLAHELRNPLAPIRYAVAILGMARSEADRERAVGIIARQSAHMSRLLDDLLDMSRITRNVVELQRQTIDLRVVVRHALEAVEPLYGEKQQRVSLSLPPQPVLVDGDPTRLQQVLGNLLDNAAKYSPAPGEVAVHVALDAGEGSPHAEVSVADQGIGIAPEMRPQVFELFSRIDGSGTAPAGLGIGLAVSRQLVELHGGTIAVHSEGLGCGSRFVVRLPLSAARPESTAAAAASELHRPDERITVMVVDDNVDGADTLAEVLGAAHYGVVVAHSGGEALANYKRARPRVVLLDIGLPDMPGTEVARRLRAGNAREALTLIAVTGWGQQADRDSTAAAGFDAHLVKPVDLKELDRLIRGLLATQPPDAGPAAAGAS